MAVLLTKPPADLIFSSMGRAEGINPLRFSSTVTPSDPIKKG